MPRNKRYIEDKGIHFVLGIAYIVFAFGFAIFSVIRLFIYYQNEL